MLPDKAPKFHVDFEKYILDNGIEVILHQDLSDPIVAVAILYHVGSSREKKGKTGFAHFFEHMLFQNSENVGKGKFLLNIEDMGGTVNGGTWQDGTIYYEVVPINALEKVLWMESDRMGFMINTVTQPVLDNEKEVVKNEKKQRIDNQPYGHANYILHKYLYPSEHPYHWQVIGSMHDLQTATIEDVKTFYHQYYGPNNATLVIAGFINIPEVKALIKKYFAEIPSKPPVTPLHKMPVRLPQSQRLYHEDALANLPELILAWPGVEEGHADSYPLEYLAHLISSGKRAPLYKDLVEHHQYAPRVNASHQTGELAGKFVIRIRTNAGVNLEDVYTRILDVLDQFEHFVIDERDMLRIKNSQEIGFYEGIASVLNKSFQLAQFNVFRGDPGLLNEEVNRILAVTEADIKRVFKKYIHGLPHVAVNILPKSQSHLAMFDCQTAEVETDPPQLVLDTLAPSADNTPSTPTLFDRSQPPGLGSAPSVNLPEIWSGTTDYGLHILGISNHEMPMVEFNLRLKGGHLLDQLHLPGEANLISDMLMEGTARRTPEELQDAIGVLGSNIEAYAYSEYIEICGNTLTKNLSATLELVREILLEPRWDEQEFKRIKKKTIAHIHQREARPDMLGNRIFLRLLYGAEHPLGHPITGEVHDVEQIELAALKKYYLENFSSGLATMHFSGAIDSPDAFDVLKNWSWTNTGKILTHQMNTGSVQPGLYILDSPGAKQAVLLCGQMFVPGDHPDFTVASLINYRLGGSYNSLLNTSLREERGYTYGVHTYFSRRWHPGVFILNTSVGHEVASDALRIIKQHFEQFASQFSGDDLVRTREIFLRSQARGYETLGQKLKVLENISLMDLPLDYLREEDQRLRAINIEEAQTAIQRYLNPQKMIYLVVGDALELSNQFKSVGLFSYAKILDRQGSIIQTDQF